MDEENACSHQCSKMPFQCLVLKLVVLTCLIRRRKLCSIFDLVVLLLSFLGGYHTLDSHFVFNLFYAIVSQIHRTV